MSIREIDDRYPEFARPYEPVKGGRHYRKLGGPGPLPLLFGALVILMSLRAMVPETPQAQPDPPVFIAMPVSLPTDEPAPVPAVVPVLPTEEPTAGPTSTPSPTPTPTPISYTPPVFSDAHAEHDPETGMAAVGFTVSLNASAKQEGTAALYRKDPVSGQYEKAAAGSASLLYGADRDASWTVPDGSYDPLLLPLDTGGRTGAIEWLKIRFDYAYPTGAEDHIESDELPVCLGTFVSFDRTDAMASGFMAFFPIDTTLVPDLSGLTPESATLYINGRTVDLTGRLSVSEGEALASVSSLYERVLAEGESLTPGASYPLDIALRYRDEDQGIDWVGTASGSLDITIWGDYLGAGTVFGLLGTEAVETDGFIAEFPLDASVVHDPTAYGPDESLTVEDIVLIRRYTGTSLLGAAGCTYEFVTPTEGHPILRIRYAAPEGDPLFPSEYSLSVNVSYSSAGVTDLVDSNSADFEILQSGDNIYAYDGSFEYSPDFYLGGSIELRKGVDYRDLSAITFTVYQTLDGEKTDVTALVDPNSHIIQGDDGDQSWIGFEIVASDTTILPTLDPEAEYTVKVRVTWEGTEYESKEYRIE